MFNRIESAGSYALTGAMMVLVMAVVSPRPVVSIQSPPPETTVSIPRSDGLQRQRIPVEVLRVIDGDTVEVRAHIWLDQQVQARIRLRAIDAPELKAACPQEATLAVATRDNLAALLAGGPVYLGDVGRDKYGGRFLGTLHTGGGLDVAEVQIASGHARAYDGKKRRNWC
ncbi:MAG: thermonuclease family protein [Beijerinckiaceae bacterium]